jgi:hypothetical protein
MGEVYNMVISKFSGGAYNVSISKSISAYVYFLVHLTHGLIERKIIANFDKFKYFYGSLNLWVGGDFPGLSHL